MNKTLGIIALLFVALAIGWPLVDRPSLEGIGGVAVANLFLHHFEDDQLAEMGRMLEGCEVICISEPWRSRLALLEGRFLYPFVNGVTRHDIRECAQEGGVELIIGRHRGIVIGALHGRYRGDGLSVGLW